jgi:hypothetical protein
MDKHSEHCRIFLAMLTAAAEQGKAVPTYELAKVSRNHTARISNLRSAGHDIKCEDMPHALRMGSDGRQTQYRYIGFTGKNMAGVMESATNSLKPCFVKLTHVRDGDEHTTFLRPEANREGFSVTFKRPLEFQKDDQLIIEYVAQESHDLHPRELPLRIGGVMRCCIHTLDNSLVREAEGDTLRCHHCKSRLRVREGAWEWDDTYKETTCA